MNLTRLDFLFQAYINKTASLAERDELMALLERSGHDEQVKELISRYWDQFDSEAGPFSEGQGDAMLQSIIGKVPAPVKEISPAPLWLWRRRIAVAAAILLLLTAGLTGWFLLNKPQEVVAVKDNNNISREPIVPGTNKAVLTLADGSRLELDSGRHAIPIRQGNTRIVNLPSSVLSYHPGQEKEEIVVYNTLSTPVGGQYQLLLADGTKVWLNASSSIRFPVAFKGKERKVTVTGEAYFEVARNTAMPFLVTTRDMTLEVLGTHFNIMAYEDEDAMNTTLLEGAVKVSRGADMVLLRPGQQSRVAASGKIRIEEADTEEVMAWKNGWFQFVAYDIEKVMRQVARWYDVQVVYEGKKPTGHFTGMVNRQNNIGQVLKIMQASGVSFRIEGHRIIVSEDHSSK